MHQQLDAIRRLDRQLGAIVVRDELNAKIRQVHGSPRTASTLPVALTNRHCCVGGSSARAGWADASSSCPSVSAVVRFCRPRLPPEVIMVAVRCYLRYGLSYRDVEEFLGERGIEVDHVTIYRWVQRFTPLLVDAARPLPKRPGRSLVRG